RPRSRTPRCRQPMRPAQPTTEAAAPATATIGSRDCAPEERSRPCVAEQPHPPPRSTRRRWPAGRRAPTPPPTATRATAQAFPLHLLDKRVQSTPVTTHFLAAVRAVCRGGNGAGHGYGGAGGCCPGARVGHRAGDSGV